MAKSLLTRASAAARAGDLDHLDRILSESPEVIAARGGHGRTLLDLACRAAPTTIAIPLVPGTPAAARCRGPHPRRRRRPLGRR